MFIVGFLLAAFLVALTPGANNLLALRHSMLHGLVHSAAGIVGRILAFAILVIAVVAGLGPLLSASELALEIIKWAGVTYLVYLGARTIWETVQRRRTGEDGADDDADDVPDAAAPGPRHVTAARKEFVVAITNPKAILVFTAFVPQFVVPAQDGVTEQLAQLGTLYLLAEASAAIVFAVAGRIIGRARLSLRARRNLDRGTGVVLIGMAGALAYETI